MCADGVLQLFARRPVPGWVKTRLIPALGSDGAAALQERLTAHLIAQARASSFRHVELWLEDTPGAAADPIGPPAWPRRTQPAGDLGTRMHRALERALQRHPYAVLAGSDCPTLRGADLDRAGRWLAGGADAVLGPVLDGGYALIGLRRAAAALFEAVPWGTAQVAGLTRARLRSLGWSWVELPYGFDVDEAGDLRRLRRYAPELAPAPGAG